MSLQHSKEFTMSDKTYTEADLFRTWNEMSAKKFENKKFEKQEIMNAIKSKSELTITNLKEALDPLKASSAIAMLFLAFCAIYDFTTGPEKGFWVFAICLIIVGGIMLFAHYKLKQIETNFNTNTPLLEIMKANLKILKRVLFAEKLSAQVGIFLMFVYVIYEEVLEMKLSWETQVGDINFIVFMASVSIIGYAISRRMIRKKYGEKIKELEENIVRLELLQ